MIDPGTGLTLLGSAIGGAKVIEKILGPTSDYIGDQLKEWTQKKVENTSKIFQNAERKLGDRIDSEGSVPPKVLKGILEEGAWCEDELQIEYFGGVLASARSGLPRDDRGAYFTSLISRLTSYQIRTHYLFYKTLKLHYNNKMINVAHIDDRQAINILMPYSTYQSGMDFTDEELNSSSELVAHSLWGLCKEDLISNTFCYGQLNYIQSKFPTAKEGGIIFSPTVLGVQLSLWAYGQGQSSHNSFFKSETVLVDSLQIAIDKTYML